MNSTNSSQPNEAQVELSGLNQSKMMAKHPKNTEKSMIQTIIDKQTNKTASKPTSTYYKSMYDTAPLVESPSKKKIQNYIKNNLTAKAVK